jgi:uncharacterized protein YciI
MKYVLIYETDAPDRSLIEEHLAAHQARWAHFRDQGTLLLIGPFTDETGGAMAVFATPESAEEFAAGDPFVLHGVVTRWRIRPWYEVLLPVTEAH